MAVEPFVADDGPVLLTARSALAAPKAVVAVALLFAGVGSGVVALDTLAVLATLVPVKFAAVVNVLVIVFVCPGVIVPSAQGNVVAHAPLFETKPVPAGVASETETAVASDGPLFVTVIV